MILLTVRPDGLRAAVSFGSIGAGQHEDAVAAAGASIDEAFGSGVRQILWRSQVGDVAARRVAWSCGFTFHGHLRADWRVGDRLADSWTATLLATDSRLPKTRWLEPVRLTAAGVVCRDQLPQDRDRYVETMADPETVRWLGPLLLPSTPQEFDQMLARRFEGASLGARLAWTVADPVTDTYLASINLFGMDGKDYKSAEVGYRSHPDARGRGVLSSALRLVVAHAFDSEDGGGLGLERISLGAGEGNLASQRVAQACGFTETGRDRRSYDLDDGSVVDLIRFDRLRSDP
jgi:RimJ/RimL family protein N-acetyltransferase